MIKNIPYKNLCDYTDEELIDIINNNGIIELKRMAGYVSEILRRMNERSPLLRKEEDTDWANPLVL